MESVDAYLFVNVEIDSFFPNEEVSYTCSSSYIKYINEINIYLIAVAIVHIINYIPKCFD